MKKTIITMLIALVAMVTSAETYNYLKFTKTNGTTMTYSVEGLKLTYSTSNVTITNVDGTATIALSEVQDMFFSNEAGTVGILGDVNGDGLVNVTDVTLLISAVVNEDYSEIIFNNGDMNGDGVLTVTDVTLLISAAMEN